MRVRVRDRDRVRVRMRVRGTVRVRVGVRVWASACSIFSMRARCAVHDCSEDSRLDADTPSPGQA